MNEEMLRDRLRRNLLVQEVMGREVQPRLRIGEEDLRRYLQRAQRPVHAARGARAPGTWW
jgi:hypothetical protein